MTRAIGVVVIGVICLGVPAVAGAQGGVGVKGGLALSEVTGEDSGSLQWLTAWSVGGFASVPVAKGVFFQPEVLYTRKGAEFRDESGKAWTHLDYVEFPLLVRFSPSSSGRVGLDLFAGIAPAVKARARMTIEDVDLDADSDISDLISSWDAGFVAGGGMHAGAFSAEVRWTEGLVNVVKDSSEKSRNRTISVLAGYRF